MYLNSKTPPITACMVIHVYPTSSLHMCNMHRLMLSNVERWVAKPAFVMSVFDHATSNLQQGDIIIER